MTLNTQQIIEFINNGITPTTTFAEILTFLTQHFPLFDSNLTENRYRFGMEDILITLIQYPAFFVLSIAERTTLRVISKTEGGIPISIEIGN
jgi:hypothetical protein